MLAMYKPQQAVSITFILISAESMKIIKENLFKYCIQLDEKVNSWWRPQVPAGLFISL
jgi:hypothetical protein